MTIKPTHRLPTDPDRSTELQQDLAKIVEDVIAEANGAGYGTEETIEALDEVVEAMEIAYDEDPDPAEDPTSEDKWRAYVQKTRSSSEDGEYIKGDRDGQQSQPE